MNTQIVDRRRMSGFTLIEIMVVVVIIGLLAAIVVPSVVGNLDEAAITRAKQDIRTIEVGLQQFRIDNYRYPTEEEGLEVLLGSGQTRGIGDDDFEQYLPRLPVDPWGNDYLYANPSDNGQRDYDVFTLGADEEEGGEGVNADIGSWNLD